MIRNIVPALAVALYSAPVPAGSTPAPEGAAIYFIAPEDGARVGNPVVVRFGLKGMGVAPAGLARESTGHHHLLVDTDKVDLNQPLPADEHVRHFGGGQTEAEIELPPGAHTLQLLLGDHNHIPHNPPVMSEKITIIVE